MTVYIDYESDDKLELDVAELLNTVVAETAAQQNCPWDVTVNVLMTDAEQIHRLNSEFRGIDSPTDVLSFPAVGFTEPVAYSEVAEDPGFDFDPDTGELVLGDIAISVDHVRSQAEEYGHGIRRELAFLIVHSLLHLFGYDHIEDEDRLLMEAEQKKILDSLQIFR